MTSHEVFRLFFGLKQMEGPVLPLLSSSGGVVGTFDKSGSTLILVGKSMMQFLYFYKRNKRNGVTRWKTDDKQYKDKIRHYAFEPYLHSLKLIHNNLEKKREKSFNNKIKILVA